MTSVSLGANISALTARRYFDANTARLTGVTERLSSGLRINRASDDAAGLAVSTSLNADARVFYQGLRNINDAISALSISDGTLSTLSSIATRHLELAEQAANGTFSLGQRKALQAESEALVDEFNRLVASVSFNGRRLLDGSTTDLQVQAGYGTDGLESFRLTQELARRVGTGGFTGATTFATTYTTDLASADFNGDGILDSVLINATNSYTIRLGNGDGTFKAGSANAMDLMTANGVSIGDFNGDGIADFVVSGQYDTNPFPSAAQIFLGNGNGTFQLGVTLGGVSTGASFSGVLVADLNNDGYDDVVGLGGGSSTRVRLSGPSGFVTAGVSYNLGTVVSLTAADINNDGILDLIGTSSAGNGLQIALGNGNGSFAAAISFATGASPNGVQAGDFDLDGNIDIAVAESGKIRILLGNGNGTFDSAVTYSTVASPSKLILTDLNGDGISDLVANDTGASQFGVLLGNGDGTFRTSSFASTSSIEDKFVIDDFDRDGVADILALGSGGLLGFYKSNTTTSTFMPHLNLLSQEGARSAISVVNSTLQRISLEIGANGSAQSRLSVALNVLSDSRENYLAAAGRITDADIAGETADLVRTQILQRAAAAVLAQANQQPALSLSLLKG